jgi:hypothetical protein
VNKNVRAAFASDKAKTFCFVENWRDQKQDVLLITAERSY